MAESGTKHDSNKLRYDLISPIGLRELAKVYTIGAEKYGDNNWRKGIKFSRLIGAMLRHIEQFRMGIDTDPDDGQHPLASVAWCAFALMEYQLTGRKELDDRIILKTEPVTEDSILWCDTTDPSYGL